MAKGKKVSASPFGDKEFLPDAILAEVDEITKTKFESVTDEELPDMDVEDFNSPIAGDEDMVREWIDKYKIEVEEDEPVETKTDKKPTEDLAEESEDDLDENNGEQSHDEESPDGIAEKLVNDKNFAWGLYKKVRHFIYEIAYDFVVEKPNEVGKLESIRSALIRKRNKTAKDQSALENIDKFIQECQSLRKDYFARIVNLHELQEELGKEMLNIELKRLHKKGLLSKWVVYGMVFGLPTADNIRAMLSVKREIRASKPRSNA